MVFGRASIRFLRASRYDLYNSSFFPPFLHDVIPHSPASIASAIGPKKSNEQTTFDVGLKVNSSFAFLLNSSCHRSTYVLHAEHTGFRGDISSNMR